MELELLRYSNGSDDSLGLLRNLDDCTLLAFTLEDEFRTEKVSKETRIPDGRYQIKLRNVGGFNSRYKNHRSSKIRAMHKGMLCLSNRPDWVLENDGMKFQYILIHCGNDEDDTAGCVLVGDSIEQNLTKNGFLGKSTPAYERVYPIITKALETEEVWITVKSLD